MPIVYSLISRGESLVCDATHPLHSGNFKQVSLKLLHKVHGQQKKLHPAVPAASSPSQPSSLPSSFSKQTLLFNGHTFNFCFTGSIYCVCVCDGSMKASTPFLFLTDVLSTFLRVSNEGQSSIEGPSLKALTEVLLNKMESYSDEAFILQQQLMAVEQSAAAAAAGGGGGGGEKGTQFAGAGGGGPNPSATSSSSSSVSSVLPHSSSSSSSAVPSSSSSSVSSASASSHRSAASPPRRPSPDDADDAVDGGGDDPLVQNVRRELDGVKEQLMDNFDRVMSRGEALESLVDRSAALHDSSDQFKTASSRLKAQLRWQQIRSAITLLTMSAIIVYIIAAAKCGVALNSC